MIRSRSTYPIKRAALGALLMLIAAFAQTGMMMPAAARGDAVTSLWIQICSFAGIDWRVLPRSDASNTDTGAPGPFCPLCGPAPSVDVPRLGNAVLVLAEAPLKVAFPKVRSLSDTSDRAATHPLSPRAPPMV